MNGNNEIKNLEPKIVWDIFDNITKYPRPSKKEEKIIAYIEDFANNLGLKIKKDEIGNLTIKKPATAGMENKKSICIQAHVDMVCEKNRDVEFDFDNDSIQTYIDGDWVKAKGTTLGADNGMGLAMGMAVLASNDLKHPEFELLCTIDEETGLTGAIQLGTDLLTSDLLINLDTEEDGHFTIGCAGGINTNIKYDYDKILVNGNYICYEIGLKGLMGGHSGIEINDGRSNSISLLSRMLVELSNVLEFKLNSVEGGNKHNAIPREAFATIAINENDSDKLNAFLVKFESVVKEEIITKEVNFEIISSKIETFKFYMTDDLKTRLINALFSCPTGVIRMNPDINTLVQTSLNLAVITTTEDSINILTSQRSLRESEKFSITDRINSLFELSGADVKNSDGYPAWQPNVNSELVKSSISIYEKLYGKKPIVETIHAGLECGLVGEKYPKMDMISFGPTLKEVHTPNEKIQISTVATCWEYLVKLLENLPNKN